MSYSTYFRTYHKIYIQSNISSLGYCIKREIFYGIEWGKKVLLLFKRQEWKGIHALKADEDEKKALKYLLLSSFYFPIFWISYGFFFWRYCWTFSALVLRFLVLSDSIKWIGWKGRGCFNLTVIWALFLDWLKFLYFHLVNFKI